MLAWQGAVLLLFSARSALDLLEPLGLSRSAPIRERSYSGTYTRCPNPSNIHRPITGNRRPRGDSVARHKRPGFRTIAMERLQPGHIPDEHYSRSIGSGDRREIGYFGSAEQQYPYGLVPLANSELVM